MRCPFLKEAQVRFCGAAAVRKLIAVTPGNGRCASRAYPECPTYRERPRANNLQETCPYLESGLAQYCAAAAVRRLVPGHAPEQTRCGGSRHRYCDVYLANAGPRTIRRVEDVPVATDVYYAANHMWLDLGEDGCCFVGMDAFLARMAGPVVRVDFVPVRGPHHPAATLVLRGGELNMVFPNPLSIVASNPQLRSDPARLCTDPYGSGWVYEARANGTPAAAGLLAGDAAVEWMGREVRRLAELLKEMRAAAGATYLLDGGLPAPDFLSFLDKEERRRVFHEFFSPLASWTVQS